MTGASPVFPLPKGYFGPVTLSAGQESHLRELVRLEIALALKEEAKFVQQSRQVDAAKWRLAKQKSGLAVYRRKSRSLAAGSSKPSMLGVGQLDTTLEDLVYGVCDKSHEEFRMTVGITSSAARDCTVLHSLEVGVPEDPFRYLGIKWALTSVPMVRNRDWCYLEAGGIAYDDNGERYAYIVTHSIDLDNCPPFPKRVALRAKVYFTYIFRECVQDGVVNVFSRGRIDPSGEVLLRMETLITAHMLTAIARGAVSAEAKKLTMLALNQLQDAKATSPVDKSCCFVCNSTSSVFASLRACRICGLVLCSRCYVKRYTFVGPNRQLCLSVCCPKCVVRAKEMVVRPQDRSFLVKSDRYLPQMSDVIASPRESDDLELDNDPDPEP